MGTPPVSQNNPPPVTESLCTHSHTMLGLAIISYSQTVHICVAKNRAVYLLEELRLIKAGNKWRGRVCCALPAFPTTSGEHLRDPEHWIRLYERWGGRRGERENKKRLNSTHGRFC